MIKKTLIACISITVLFSIFKVYTTNRDYEKLSSAVSLKEAEYAKKVEEFTVYNNESKSAVDVSTVITSAKQDGESVVAIQNKSFSQDNDLSKLSKYGINPSAWVLLPATNAKWQFATNFSANTNSLPVGFLYTDGEDLYAYALADYAGGKFNNLKVRTTKAYFTKVYGHNSTEVDRDVNKTLDILDRLNEDSTENTNESVSDEDVYVPETEETEDVDNIGDVWSEYERESRQNE